MGLLSITLCLLTGGCGEAEKSPLFSVTVEEIAPGERQLLHYPTDGHKVLVNPPGFTWTEHPEATGYQLALFREGALDKALLVLKDLKSTVAALDAPLESGQFVWLVLYESSEGVVYGRSEQRRFELAEGLPELPLPDVGKLKQELTGKRPRIFLTAERMARIRSAIEEKRIPLWETYESLLAQSLSEPLYPEPAPYKDGIWTTPEWRRTYTPAKVGSSIMVRLALAYRLFGKDEYLQRAKEWLLHLSSWDPRGITSHDVPLPDGTQGNDEASMPMLERMAIAYDWIEDQLSEEEKKQVYASITERGNQVLAVLKEQDFLSKPFSNHEGRVLAFLGLAGLSFLDVVPDASVWLDYVLRCYLTSYPTWGGDDGGWAQGMSYWSAYVIWLTGFADALRSVTEVDIYRKPFFRNTGYFPVYFLPPYAVRGAFGDGGEGGPNLTHKLLVKKFAAAFEDPMLLWHSEEIPVGTPLSGREWNQWVMEDVHSVLDAAPATLQPKAPTDLPPSRWLKNIGWAAAHTELGNAENDVWVLFKSSRFGSISHSHADQNSFQLNAYGEPLLIDSGYYPFYGSPHHTLWTRQTRAHNAVLINWRGHDPYSMAARGKIEYFEQDGHITKMLGEAAEAYNIPLGEGTLELWKEHLETSPPSMEPRAELARRALAFVASEERPFMAVHDYLKTAAPTRFQYMLHALEPMSLEEGIGKLSLTVGKASLDVYLISNRGLQFSQTDQFLVPPDDRYQGAENQYHFTAETGDESSDVKFLALYLPYRAGSQPPEVRMLEEGELRGFQIGEERVLVWWGDGETGVLSEEIGTGRMFVESKAKTVLCE